MTELNRFVTIALSTGAGGEDALTQDKLSNLRTVGSGFAPLIYILSKNAGFIDFTMQCSQVWMALKSNKDLPSLLVNSMHVHVQVYLFVCVSVCICGSACLCCSICQCLW